MSDATTPSPSLDVTLLVTLTTALIYAAGWAYAYHWFSRFNLGIIGLDIPYEYFVMYGFWSIRAHCWWLAFGYVALVALWMFFGKLIRPWVWRTAPISVLLLFWLAYGLGGSVASADYATHAGNEFACYPLVRLGVKAEAKRTAPIDELAKQLTDRDYRLLLQTKSLLVLIKPKAQTDPVPALVELSNVDLLRLTPVNPGCHD